jgi:hypothetical protein
MKCFGRSGASKNSPTKFCFWVSHEQKLQQKYTSPNQEIHIVSKRLLSGTKPTYNEHEKTQKKVLVGCKDRPKRAVISLTQKQIIRE